ncbi:hypothetical protein MA9V1_190 [Chryseobacterium phage MA9V-1]|nr:hypothetical protein MA9V1_190 [Chryseobacterium phage MA9V-1]
MSIKYGLNQFKNTADNSTEVVIDNGLLYEIGIPIGEVNEATNNIYVTDASGKKIRVPIHDAIIQSIQLMSDDVKSQFKSSVFGEIDLLPASISGAMPFMLTSADFGKSIDVIIYGKNMNMHDTANTKVALVDKNSGAEIVATTWNTLNVNQMQATFKIPAKCKATAFLVAVTYGDIAAQSTAEIIVNTSVTFEPVELNFTKFGEEYCIATTPKSITFSPLFNNNIGADSVSVTSEAIDCTKNFVLSADLAINTKSGASLNAIDLTRSGFGLGFAGQPGEVRFDGVNMDLRDFKPRFNTFLTKEPIKHVKFIKQGNSIYKLLYSDNSVYTFKTILSIDDDIAICASMQRLDDSGSIINVSYNNITLKTF